MEDDLLTAASTIADAASAAVHDVRGVRVEDYLATLAAAAGEAALVASGFDIEGTDLAPGSPVFGDAVNVKLTGDTVDPAAMPADSVIGLLLRQAAPAMAALGVDFKDLYRHVAASVGAAPWGEVTLRVPHDNLPRILPLRAAYELRPAVEAAEAAAGIGVGRRHELVAAALAKALGQVAGAVDMAIGVQLAMEVLFGTAKLVPMSRRALAAAAAEELPPPP